LEWNETKLPLLVWTCLNGTILFYFLEKYLKKFFVLPASPSNKKNSFDHHNSYNKGLNLACNGLLESPLNFPSTKKVSKNPITNWNHGINALIFLLLWFWIDCLGLSFRMQFMILSKILLFLMSTKKYEWYLWMSKYKFYKIFIQLIRFSYQHKFVDINFLILSFLKVNYF
jgi:hypothetical protein